MSKTRTRRLKITLSTPLGDVSLTVEVDPP